MDLQGDAGATQRSRTGEALITPPLEAVWPDVERRLRALLYRRGLDHASAEDVVQEVAVRALAHGVTFTSARDLLRWAGPVACNLHVDLLRQRARLQDGDVDQDRPATHDVAREVADRLELQRALRGIAALRPADRAAIMDAVNDDAAPPRNRQEAVRLAVRRHRARSRLAVLMQRLAVWTLGWRLLRRPRAAAAATAALLVPAAMFPLVVGSPAPREATVRPAPEVVEQVARPTPGRGILTARAARPRTAGGAAERSPAARPDRAAGEPRRPAPTTLVEVEGPGGTKVGAKGDERRPEDRIVCFENLPYVGDLCV